MKLTSEQEQQLTQVYEAYWAQYLEGNVPAMEVLLDESYSQVGSAESEVFTSKKEAVQFLQDTIDEVAGKLEMRNRITQIEQQDTIVMVHERCNLYALDGEQWVFYSKFRATTLLTERRDGWKIIHQHSSFPDSKTEEGQNVAIDKIAEENKELREAVRRRTVELKDKNRELEIEAALERVRSKTMAMHNSHDVADTVVTLFDEVMKLGIDNTLRCGIGILEGREQMETWSANYKPNGEVDLKMGMLNMTIHPMLVGLKKAWKNKKKGYSYDFIGKDVIKYYTALNKEPEYPYNADLKTLPENVYHKSFFYSSGILFAFTENPISKEGAKVLNRFADVLGQTYRRYLDLQKAEEQAREANIESALERVRTSSMAMHKSEQLPETAEVLFEQFAIMGDVPDRISIAIFREEENLLDLWVTDQIGGQLNHRYVLKLDEATTIAKAYKAWKEGKESIVIDLSGQSLTEWLNYVMLDVKLPVDDSNIKGRRIQHAAFFSEGFLLFTTNEPVADENLKLLIRFAKVFDQTYTRFLDLQKAEAQAREAQIEASLERVRSKAMVMHRSEELGEVATVLHNELISLNVLEFSKTSIIIHEESSQKLIVWGALTGSDSLQKSVFPLLGDQVLQKLYDTWRQEEEFFTLKVEGKALRKHIDFVFPKVSRTVQEDAAIKSMPDPTFFHCAFFCMGYLELMSDNELSEASSSLLVRFAKVFDQAYVRFLDLQKAEAQAREATKQTSLDRVRGQIASMRTAADLERITPLVWHELTTLGIPFIRCGVFIIDESSKHMQVHLSAPDGHSLGVMEMPFDADQLTANSVAYWQRGEVFKGHWNKEEFIEFMQTMVNLGQIENIKVYQGAEQPPESLHLHFLPFTQGMLYVGNVEPLADDQIESVQSLADAFAIAYARYEDFTKLEKAKQNVETTLTELKTTQTQLIQSEKMASLGELTAGIAHEIQNPLNFVNNFSEVSVELIEEMQEELEKGDLKEAGAIADDVKLNLDKITYHGKRADGIVKGMLQHSRSSSGHKEPTDINALADEYLRLAYHGLRAKDKTFNATVKTDFDESMVKINVVPQDIGRVILNLITNAFYACTERKKLNQTGYEPTVEVTTKKEGNQVLISVKDNGNGIPKKVLDKIFQPFFTTKPTGQGTGLGLSLSYDIVKAQGGELEVETKEGEGSEFILFL